MTRSAPSRGITWSLAILLPLALSLVILSPALRWDWTFLIPGYHAYFGGALLRIDAALPGLLPSVGLAIIAYYATLAAVGACRHVFIERGFKGRDLMKPDQTDYIPETLGLPASCIYLLVLFLFIPFRYYVVGTQTPEASRDRRTDDGGWYGDLGGRTGFPHHELAVYLSALLSLLSSLILGFCDDVFDIRWRFKMPIPIVASIPMLLVYYAGRGGTGLVVPGWPAWLRTLVGANVIDLGFFYYVFISLLSTFCTHSINILAGINGVEVGQALVIAGSLCLNDALYLPLGAVVSGELPQGGVGPLQNELVGRHLFSLSLMLPLVGTCAGLLAWNRFPALVFVGDTFCYFAGQALACAGVLGHFSKTLLLFFLPQVFNFLLSCPQLFGFVPCPRHRVPKVHRKTMALYPSIAMYSPAKSASTLGSLMLLILEQLRLVVLYREGDLDATSVHPRSIVGTTNLTLLNAILVVSGVRTPIEEVRKEFLATFSKARATLEPPQAEAHPALQGPHIDERRLWRMMMGLQLIGSAIAFAVRYWAAAIVFPQN
ncbi:unnamed protein product [Parajaminaea phylloscopi]